MNEDEKKAIKVLKVNPKIIAELDKDLLYKMFEFEGQSIEELKDWSYKIVLNLIEKQQKEISELKEEINYWKEYAEGEAGLRKQIQEDYQEQMQELLESEE